jgi:hypothetical protein
MSIFESFPQWHPISEQALVFYNMFNTPNVNEHLLVLFIERQMIGVK